MVADDGTVLEETSYYPFGLTQKGISYTNPMPSLQNKYLYNGKEQQMELGLDSYDYGARMYNAQIGRWFQPDPVSEKYFSVSPYNYTLNNPISLFDPDGRDAIIEFDRDKEGNITGIRISSTIYISGGTSKQRTDFAKAGNDAFKKYNKLFSNKDGVDVSISITYDNIDNAGKNGIGDGNNILTLDDLENAERESQVEFGAVKTRDENGVVNGTEPDVLTSTIGNLRADAKSATGETMLHESLHLMGLMDRYSRSKAEATAGVVRGGNGKIKSNDVMAYGVSWARQKLQMSLSPLHFQNWRNYIFNPPQVQQQVNQSKGQFILKYVVDAKADKQGKLKLIN